MKLTRLVLALVFAGCVAQEPLEPSDGESDSEQLQGARPRFIHVGGICSTDWTSGKKTGVPLGEWSDVDSIDAKVDQRSSMAQAVFDLKSELDRSCTDENWCYLHGYSNGAAVISKTLATYEEERWNILWVLTASSNEGGSELSGGSLAQLGDTLGLSCELAAHISPTDHRSAWNHDDTNGNIFYSIGGYREWWYTGSVPDFFDNDTNDGAVAAHSSAGLNDTYSVPDDEPWMCFEAKHHFANHQGAFDCAGYDADHFQMALRGIEVLGG